MNFPIKGTESSWNTDFDIDFHLLFLFYLFIYLFAFNLAPNERDRKWIAERGYFSIGPAYNASYAEPKQNKRYWIKGGKYFSKSISIYFFLFVFFQDTSP